MQQITVAGMQPPKPSSAFNLPQQLTVVMHHPEPSVSQVTKTNYNWTHQHRMANLPTPSHKPDPATGWLFGKEKQSRTTR